jgi:predicted permease
MEREFRDELAASPTPGARARLWLRTLADLAVSIPARYTDELIQDSRHTLRLWAARPGHTASASAALAIGIGAATGGFSFLNALLLRSLPFSNPARLASLNPNDYIPPHGTAAQFHSWLAQSPLFADGFLVEEFNVNLGGAAELGRLHIALSTANLFSALGVSPILGRAFAPGEDAPGQNPVAVISHGLWQQRYASSPQALGATIRLNGEPFTIIGVAPPEFDYPGGAALWTPGRFSPGNNGWATVLRLRPGIPWAAAEAALEAEAQHAAPPSLPRQPLHLRSLQHALAGPARRASLLLMAALGLMLLIACINAANLLITRTADRRPEFFIRAALGASAARLQQQLLTECALLAAAATACGLLIAVWISTLAEKLYPPPLASQSYSIFDIRVFVFAALTALASCAAFGILPSLYAARGSNAGPGARRLRETLAALQVLLTVVLAVASLSAGRAIAGILTADRGFDAHPVVTLGIALEGTAHQPESRRLPYFEEAIARLRLLPGVQSASATEFLPLYADSFVGGPFGLDGRRAPRNSTMIPILAGYFETMGGRILAGREFTPAEVRSNAKVALVNERFARSFGPPEEIVGRRLTAGKQNGWTIIGVVQGMDYETDPSLAKGNQVFVPSTAPGGFFSTLVVCVQGDPAARLAEIRDTVHAIDPAVPLFSIKTMQQRVEEFYARPRHFGTALWMFAAFATLLAAIGIHGIVSYTVVQRTREMGIRMALGTTPSQTRKLLLAQNLAIVAAGALPGLAIAWRLGPLLASAIEGAVPPDPLPTAALLLALFIIAAGAIWNATSRITTLDIAAILRTD